MRKIFITMFALLALFSCESDDGSSGGSSVDPGTIKVTLNYDEDLLDGTEAFIINCNGVEYQFAAGETELYLPNLDPGVYLLHIYNDAAGCEFKLNSKRQLIASYAAIEGNDTEFVAASEPLYYQRAIVTMTNYTGVVISPYLKSLTGSVSVSLKVTAGNALTIETAESLVTGVVTSWNCTTNTVDDSKEGNIITSFNSKLSSIFYLFDIKGSSQQMTYFFNEERDISDMIDLSSTLEGFSSDKQATYSLSQNITAPVLTTEDADIDERESSGEITDSIE